MPHIENRSYYVNSIRTVVVFAAFAVVPCVPHELLASDGRDLTPDEVISMVRARQETVVTLEVEWTQSTTFPRGIPQSASQSQAPSRTNSTFVLKESCDAAFDGVKMFSRLKN